MEPRGMKGGARSARTRQGPFWVERRYRVQPGSREVTVVLDQLPEVRRATPVAVLVFLAAWVVGPYGLAVDGIEGVIFWGWAGASAVTLIALWFVSRWKQIVRVRQDRLEIESWIAGRLTDRRTVSLDGELRVRVSRSHGHTTGSPGRGGTYSGPVFSYRVKLAAEPERELFVANTRSSVDTLLEALRRVVPVRELE